MKNSLVLVVIFVVRSKALQGRCCCCKVLGLVYTVQAAVNAAKKEEIFDKTEDLITEYLQ